MAGEMPGKIGRYEIRQELGRGMMGIVYLADDPVLGRPVALKTIHLAFVTPGEEREAFEKRFLGEARVAARLAHPGIVVVHDVGRDPDTGTLFIALEYLRGSTLAEKTAAGAPLDWREALRVTARLARALHHAHAQGVIHRDVKPANVMLLPSGEVKVMDFGIAKVPQQDLTAAGQFFGTPLYMSPEQARGDPVDGRSDLFAAGAIAYRLLTGRAAFAAENVTAILSRVQTGQPEAPSTMAPGIPEAADYVVARALAKVPADRYPDGEAMAEDIDDVLAGRSPRHRPSDHRAEGTRVSGRAPQDDARLQELLPLTPTPAARAAKVQPSHPRLQRAAIGIGAAMLLVAGLLAALTYEKRRPAPAGPERAAPPHAAPSPAADDANEPGRLAIDFDHHLRSGNLRIFVDGEEVLDQGFGGKVTKKILSLRIRKGSVDEVVKVKPGRHEVKVELQWDDNTRADSIVGTFRPGATRTLEIRILRVVNVMTLGWR